jgi:aspartyl-tRNA(Asn)/glutamyl-tRNA(Gln) amidotransferase subunit C
MKIDNILVDRLAELSKLELDESSKETMKQDLQKIFDMMDKLNELNVDGVQPLIYMSDEVNVLRADEVKGQVSKEDALLNAPQHDSDFFKVPKVIKEINDNRRAAKNTISPTPHLCGKNISMNEVIQISHLRKTFQLGTQVINALNDVSLTIHKNEYVALMGPSGSGKVYPNEHTRLSGYSLIGFIPAQ